MRVRVWVVAIVAGLVLVGGGILAVATVGGADASSSYRVTATCSQHRTQAEAQKAHDTLDADGDGVYCEANPCPCSGQPDNGSRPQDETVTQPAATAAEPTAETPVSTPPPAAAADLAGCTIVSGVVHVGLSETRYPKVRAHWDRAIDQGWPRVLTINRIGAKDRRIALLRGVPTRPGLDRDEYPMAMARTDVNANVELVPASQNRGAGSVQGIKLRRFCSGQRFEITWY